MTLPLALLAVAIDDGVTGRLLAIGAVAAYMIGMHARFSRTLGKMALGTMMVDRNDGSRVDLGAATIRWLTVVLGPLVAAFLVNDVTGLWVLVVWLPILRPPLHQGLHDLAAGTVVTSLG